MIATLTHPTKAGYKIGGSFARLLKRYPLLPIRSEKDYERATEVLQSLFGRENLNADENKFLETLLLIVSAYEKEHHDLDELAEGLKPADIVLSLMEANGMRPRDLGKLLGSESAASMILNEKRKISKRQARILARHFNVDAGLFI